MKKNQLLQVGGIVYSIQNYQEFLIGKTKAYFFSKKISQLQLDAMWTKIAAVSSIGLMTRSEESTTPSQDVDILTMLSSITYDFNKYCFDDTIGTIGTINGGWPKREPIKQLITRIHTFVQARGLTDIHPIYKTPCYPQLNPAKLVLHTLDTIHIGACVVTQYSNMRLLVTKINNQQNTVELVAINQDLLPITAMVVPIDYVYEAEYYGN
ncbi:MAG: hypothetical protein IPM57_10755 [Oligoflexia bacterium]|nr:hypothetical protein [Oligoflexia bacterium]